VVVKSDYQPEDVNICFSVLVELMTVLSKFRKNIVLVGGWIPWFLIPEKRSEHTGSLDIDIALDFNKIDSSAYKTLFELLKERGYKEGEHPYIFYRHIQASTGRTVTVKIDFLAGEYGGTSKAHRTQRIQDIRARKARGCDLAFDSYIIVNLAGAMPDGASNEIPIKIAGVVPFLVTKGMAIWESYKEKHAYDIYFVIKYYSGGIQGIIDQFKPFLKNTLVREGLGKIWRKFESVDSIGPVWVANFLERFDPEERERIQRDAFERVKAFLDGLGIQPYREGDGTV
jgi:hypothetical protein